MLNLSVPAILLYSIAGAAVLIYFPYLFVAYARFQVGMDMSAPRAMFDKLPAYGQRATWAHQNSFETFLVYLAAALLAYLTKVDSTLVAGCAIAYPVSRFFFSIFYLANIPLARSLMFGVGSFCTAVLFVASLKAAV
jgi:uncharacterized MAPEG superfamily protein